MRPLIIGLVEILQLVVSGEGDVGGDVDGDLEITCDILYMFFWNSIWGQGRCIQYISENRVNKIGRRWL